MADRFGPRGVFVIIITAPWYYWYALRRHGVTDPLDRGGRITRMPLPSEFAGEDTQ